MSVILVEFGVRRKNIVLPLNLKNVIISPVDGVFSFELPAGWRKSASLTRLQRCMRSICGQASMLCVGGTRKYSLTNYGHPLVCTRSSVG